MEVDVRLDTANPDLLVALALAEGIVVAPAGPALARRLDDLVARRTHEPPPEATRKAVRDLLRHGGFKPTGRNKPASEYLARAAAEGRFPRIHNVVDACNAYSLETAFPISLLDLDRALEGAEALEIREGREGESFVFNPSGQSIDVSGLVGVARAGGAAVGNGVKDSMATKITAETRNVLAVLYATRKVVGVEGVETMARELADLLAAHAGAQATRAWVLGG